jgi:hypothetical protein
LLLGKVCGVAVPAQEGTVQSPETGCGGPSAQFLDPELTRRATIEPPKKFVALEDGRAVPQPAFNRTHNTISKPEILPPIPVEPTTHADRSFVEALELGGKGA